MLHKAKGVGLSRTVFEATAHFDYFKNGKETCFKPFFILPIIHSYAVYCNHVYGDVDVVMIMFPVWFWVVSMMVDDNILIVCLAKFFDGFSTNIGFDFIRDNAIF